MTKLDAFLYFLYKNIKNHCFCLVNVVKKTRIWLYFL